MVETQGGASEKRRHARYRLGGLLCSLVFLPGCQGLSVDTASLIVPFQRSDVVGFVAGLGTTFAGLPDLVTMLRRRSCAGMNPRMAGIMGIFQIGWVYYGLLIASRPVIAWNLVAIGINALSVAAYLHYRRRETTRSSVR